MTDLVQTRIPAIQKSICEGDLVESTALTGTPASGSEGASGRACGGSLPVPASHLRKTILGEGAAALGMKNTDNCTNKNLFFTTDANLILTGNIAAVPLKNRYGDDHAEFPLARTRDAIPAPPGAEADDRWETMRDALVANDDNDPTTGLAAERTVITTMAEAFERLAELQHELRSARLAHKVAGEDEREDASALVSELNDEHSMIINVIKPFLKDVTLIFETGYIINDVSAFRDLVSESAQATGITGVKSVAAAVNAGLNLFSIRVTDNLIATEEELMMNGAAILTMPETLPNLESYEDVVTKIYEYYESTGQISPNQPQQARRLAIMRILKDMNRLWQNSGHPLVRELARITNTHNSQTHMTLVHTAGYGPEAKIVTLDDIVRRAQFWRKELIAKYRDELGEAVAIITNAQAQGVQCSVKQLAPLFTFGGALNTLKLTELRQDMTHAESGDAMKKILSDALGITIGGQEPACIRQKRKREQEEAAAAEARTKHETESVKLREAAQTKLKDAVALAKEAVSARDKAEKSKEAAQADLKDAVARAAKAETDKKTTEMQLAEARALIEKLKTQHKSRTDAISTATDFSDPSISNEEAIDIIMANEARHAADQAM